MVVSPLFIEEVPVRADEFCHSIFVLSLTRFAFRNPNGITYCYATFDLLLQNSSITKRCFVILTTEGRKNLCHRSFMSNA